MSETKTFEEIFLSESLDENLKTSELDILLVSDVHTNYIYLEKLKEWQIENQRSFNYIVCLGDILSLNMPENETKECISKGESEISGIISFLESICLNVIYIGGNHDPKTIFNMNWLPTLTIRSINLHGKHMKLANDLYLVGLGGAIPTVESTYDPDDKEFFLYSDVTDKTKWDGYPYYNDKDYNSDLQRTMKITKEAIAESNSTPGIQFILLTHNGPFYSSTTICKHDKCIYMGSKSLHYFLKENKDIFINIHGHTHKGKGMTNLDEQTVINPGNLNNGHFSVMKLKRNFYMKWEIKNIEFIKLY